MSDPLPNVYQVIERHRAALLAREQAQTQAMADHWMTVERALDGEMTALAYEVEAAGLRPEDVPRLTRYQRLMGQVQTELQQYADYAEGVVASAQSQWAQQALFDAQGAIIVSGVTNFDMLNVEAVQAMAGLAGDDSPLYALLTEAYGDSRDGVIDALIQGVGLGWGPSKTVTAMRNGLAHGLGRMMNIARTEQMRVYRESQRQAYIASGVVSGFMRMCAHDGRVCAACLASEGERFTLAQHLYDHPQGRCTAIPIIAGQQPIEWPKGGEWFATQDEATQLSILGPGKLELWQRGGFDFADLAVQTNDERWGLGLRPATLRELARA